MENLRRRVPFTFVESTENERGVLDEQEQEEVIDSLRKHETISNERSLFLTKTLLFLSLLLQFIAFFGPTESNPLLVTFPLDYSVQRATLPPQRLWCLISVAIHIDLWRSIFPDEHGLTSLNGFDIPPTPLLYSYGFATMAPMLSMLLRCPWQTVAWWSVPAAMVTIVHVVKNTITQGKALISELESKQYVAAGA